MSPLVIVSMRAYGFWLMFKRSSQEFVKSFSSHEKDGPEDHIIVKYFLFLQANYIITYYCFCKNW